MTPIVETIRTRIAGEAVDALGAQVRRIAGYATTWLLSHELHRLAMVMREVANELDQAANERNGVGKRA